MAAVGMVVGLAGPAGAEWPLPRSPRPYLGPGESLGEAHYVLRFGEYGVGADSLDGTGMQLHGAYGSGASLRMYSPDGTQKSGTYSIGYKEKTGTEEITRYLPTHAPPRGGWLWDGHFWDSTALWLGHSRFQPGTTGPGDTGTDVRADNDHLISIPVVQNTETKRSFLISSRVQAPSHPNVHYGLRPQPYLDRGGLGLTSPGGIGNRVIDLAPVVDQWNVLQIRADVTTNGGTKADASDDTGKVTYRYFLNNAEVGTADTFDLLASAMHTGQGDVRFGPAFGLARGWQGDAPEALVDTIAVYDLQNVPFRTSWIGETILPEDAAKYAEDRWMPRQRNVGQNVQALWVDPTPTADGKTLIYTNTHWDESARATGIYVYDGKGVIRPYGTLGAYGIALGGLAITGDADYIYASYERMVADPAIPGAKKVDASCVARYPRNAIKPDIGNPATDFPGTGALCLPDAAPSNDPQTGTAHPQSIRGLAANDRYLFVGHRKDNKVYIYPKEQVTQGRKEIAVQDPRGMAYSTKDNTLWVITEGGAAIQEYAVAADGTLTPKRKLTGPKATAVFVTPQGQLYVADDDTQQIRVFDTTKAPVQEVPGKVLGDKGGVVGAYGPAKFDGLKGVGVDNAGNYYVASNGLGSSQFAAPVTLDVRRFNGTTKALEGQVINNVNTTIGAFDPENPNVVYTPTQRYELNLDAQAPGTEWSPQQTTLTTDRYTCPTDGRVMGADGYNTAVAVRYMGPDHRKVMFTTGQGNVGRLSMFRFTADGHAQPAAIFTENIDNQVWPPNEPTKWGTGDHVWSWRDSNGDCQFGDNEFAAPMDLSVRSNWSVSEKDNLPNHRAGDVWLAGYKQSVGPVLKRVRFTGTFENGSPVYDTANVEVMPLPQPFVDAYGVVYQSATDTLYLLGVNVNDPAMRKGWQLARYDKFYEKRQTAPAATWLRPLPDDVAFCATDPNKECRINSLTAAGDRVYVGNIAGPTDDLTGRIRMFDAATGTPAGQLVPGPEVAYTSGWHDMKQAVAATQLPDGRRFVLAEENFASRILLYHGF